MGIIEIVVMLLIAGFVIFIVRSAPMIDIWFKNIICGVIILALIIWLLNGLGFVPLRLHL